MFVLHFTQNYIGKELDTIISIPNNVRELYKLPEANEIEVVHFHRITFIG